MFFIYTTLIAINIFFIPEYFEYFIIFNIELLNFIYELKNKNRVLQLIFHKKIVNSDENMDTDSDNEIKEDADNSNKKTETKTDTETVTDTVTETVTETVTKIDTCNEKKDSLNIIIQC
jgi:hypothetical protein